MHKKKAPVLCILMKQQNNFLIVLMENSDKEKFQLLYSAKWPEETASRELKNLVKSYPLINYHFVLHFEAYCTLLTEDRGLSEGVLKKTLPYLIAEQNNFQVQDDWLLHFMSSRLGFVHVFSVSPEKIKQEVALLDMSLERFYSVDCYDHGLANFIVHSKYTESPLVLVIHRAGIVRCLLIQNKILGFVQETALFEISEKEKNELLAQRLQFYFHEYAELPMIFLGFDPALSTIHLPAPWQFELWNNEKQSALLGTEKIEVDYLPLLGVGLYYAR